MIDYIEQKTHLFILANETPKSENSDVSPFRCSYCGELAKIERDEDGVPVSASCDCEDATTELSLRDEINSLYQKVSDKEMSLNEHLDTKTFDEDTRIMRYEDELISLKDRFDISE